MRALQLTEWKHEPVLRDVAMRGPSAGEVLVKVGGAGACHSDLHLMHDFEAGMVPFDPPFTLGHENAGWVAELGAGVTGLEVGQPVAVYGPTGCGACVRCQAGMENYCEQPPGDGAMAIGLGRDGGMAPYLVVPDARHLVPLTDLDPVAAAPLTDAGLTPYHAIKRSLHRLVPGSHAVVIGAGGLGHMAIQILTALSPTSVIAVDTSPEALHLAQAVGADEAVAAGDTARQEIRDLTGGRGADLVLDFVGTDPTIALAISVARQVADVTIVGVAGGSYPFGFFTVPYEVSVTTTYWGSLSELSEVVALAEAGGIRAHIEQFSLDDAPQAYERMAAGTLRGRAVIVP
jgi:alcohol dehydrogenase, propanol-preferring